MKMALEEDIAELDSVLGDLNDMMKDLNVRGVLEFFPTNNNDVSSVCFHKKYPLSNESTCSPFDKAQCFTRMNTIMNTSR